MTVIQPKPPIPLGKGRPSRLECYIRAVIRLRWAVLVASLAVGMAFAAGLPGLDLATNYRAFFSGENPEYLALQELEKTFTRNDGVLVVVQPESGTVFSTRTLGLVRELTERAWTLPHATRVDSLTNFQHTEASGDDLVVEDLYPPWAESESDAARAGDVALAEPRLARRLVSANGRTTAVSVRIELDPADNAALPSVASAVRALRVEFEDRFPDHRFGLTGIVMLNAAFAEAPLRDAPVVMPLMVGLLTLVMAWLLRSLGGTFAVLTVIGLALAITTGLAGYADTLLDPASAAAPTIILTLAVADSIHILLSYYSSLRKGAARDSAIVHAFRVNAQAVLLTSVTTAIGFLSLNASDSPPFALLGNLTAFGVMVAWALSMTVLPALLAVLPAGAPKAHRRLAALPVAVVELVIARPRAVASVVGAVALALVFALGTLVVNDKFVDYFSEDMAFRRDTDFAMKELTGIYQVSYSIPAGGSQAISDPEYLGAVDAFVTWLRARPDVVHVSSFTDTMKRLSMNMHGDDPRHHRLPEAQNLGAQYLLLYEMSLPYGLDVNDQIDIDKSALRVDVTFDNVDTRTLLAEHDAALAWLAQNGTPSMNGTVAAGPPIMFGRLARRNIDGMIVGTSLGFGLISILLALALRSAPLGALSLVPNVLPAAVAFGIWALLYREVGFAISVIGGLSIGIIVDDTVHFLAKYRRARRELKRDAEEAVRYAAAEVGPAILVTTAIVASGFAVLGLSTFRVTSYMGTLTSLAIVAALVTDLLLLPALLLVLDSSETEEVPHARVPIRVFADARQEMAS